MTEPNDQTRAGEATAFDRRQSTRYRGAAIVHAFLLACAVATVVATAGSANWRPWTLALITGLAVIGEFTDIDFPSARLRFSSSFLGLMLAAVLLGGGPAAVVGVVTIGIGWLRSREAAHHLRNNLVTYAWFPLASGLLFHAVVSAEHLGRNDPARYLLVFGTFVFALVLNFGMIGIYKAYLGRAAPWTWLTDLRVVLAPELASALLTVVSVFVYWKVGSAVLALFVIVLLVFQYLVGELLTSQRRAAALKRHATTDELTGLANRKRFGDRLEEEIEVCRERGEAFPVVLIDLDRFKEINDTLGHQYGDELLVKLAPRLAERVGTHGLVARLGGDEFALLTGIRTDRPELLEGVASELMECVREPITIGDITLEVGSSVGIARYPVDGDDPQTLLRRADIAMYAAKEHRDGFRLYDAEHDYHSTHRLSMLGDFRRALTSDEIVVHFQPIVDLRSQRVAGAEGLVRWEHPTMGLLGPAEFLQIVEQTGLIGPLTHRVLDRAIAQCARWHADGSELTVAVNLSIRNLLDPGLPAEVGRLLARYELPPEALQLEITESMIMSDPERVIATVTALGELGIRLAVDDFGTGHSSLANLRRLPIDELKVDRSFVTPMLSDESDLIIVRSTINMAHDLGLKVIAEGVEDGQTLSRLDDLGCDLAQGYHLSKPVPADLFVSWMNEFEAAAVLPHLRPAAHVKQLPSPRAAQLAPAAGLRVRR